MTAADIAQKVAQRANLQPGQIDSTSPVFPYVSQNNSNDWMFLKKLAADIGYEVLVEEGKLHFRQPASSSAGPAAGSLTNTTDPLALTMGAHILRLRSIVTSADQVGQVEVRGWDPSQKQKVVSTSPAGTSSASVGTSPSNLASVFGNATLYGVGVPLFQPDRGRHGGQGFSGPHQQRLRGTGRGSSRATRNSAPVWP